MSPPSPRAPTKLRLDELNTQQKVVRLFLVCVVIAGVKQQHMPRPGRTAGGGQGGKKDSA